jgi:uncharacterized membrane protein YhdT
MKQETRFALSLTVLLFLAFWVVVSFTGCAAKKYYFEDCQRLENGGYVCE